MTVILHDQCPSSYLSSRSTVLPGLCPHAHPHRGCPIHAASSREVADSWAICGGWLSWVNGCSCLQEEEFRTLSTKVLPRPSSPQLPRASLGEGCNCPFPQGSLRRDPGTVPFGGSLQGGWTRSGRQRQLDPAFHV
jgi:hypothetical protein